MRHVHAGTVRDLYELEDGDLLLVASDRVSVYDVTLSTEVPDKGKLLTQLSVWWLEQLGDVVAHHLVSATDVSAEFAGPPGALNRSCGRPCRSCQSAPSPASQTQATPARRAPSGRRR